MRSSLRLDRIVTLSLSAARGALPRASRLAALPILMYHSISDQLDGSVHPYFRTVTSPRAFAGQIDQLRNDGYQAITLTEALTLLREPRTQESLRRKVVLTFDDGFRDFLTAAHPVLERAAFSATVFLPTDFLGKSFVNGRPCLNPSEVRSLSDRGIEFGSHSASHAWLVTLNAQRLGMELRDSKARVEDATGRATTLFSYPFRFPEENARFVAELGAQLELCGYRAGVTTSIGRASMRDDCRFLPRLPVNDCDDAPLLRAKVAGHYDWLRASQRLRKYTRAWWQRARAT